MRHQRKMGVGNRFLGGGMGVVLALAGWAVPGLRAQPVISRLETGWVPQIEYQQASASRTKHGFDTYVATNPPQKYLVETITEEAFTFTYATWTITNSGEYYWSEKAACDGQFKFFNSVTWTAGEPANGQHRKGNQANWTDLGPVSWNGWTNGSGQESGVSTNISQLDTPGLWVTGAGLSGTAYVEFVPNAGAVGTRTVTYTTESTTPTTNGTLVLSGAMGGSNVLSLVELVKTNASDYTSCSQTFKLSSEYSTSLLGTLTESDLSSASFSSWSSSIQLASRDLSDDELGLELRKIRVRFRFQAERNTTYELSWIERTMYADVSAPETIPRSTVVFGGAGGMVTSPEFVVLPPAKNGTVQVTSARVRARCSRSCPGCEPGGPGPSLAEGARLEFDLGGAAFGQPAGALWMESQRASAALAQPQSLAYAGLAERAEVLTNSQGIAQVKSPAALAHVQVVDSYKYYLHFFALTNVGEKVDGFYQTNGSPYLSWTIENPDASPTTYNRLRVIETRPGRSITNEFTWTAGSSSWELKTGNGLRKETQSTSWSNNHTNRTVTSEVRDANDQLFAKTEPAYRLYSWGEGLDQVIEDPGGLNRTTTYQYGSTALQDEGLPVQINAADGWSASYQYQPNGTNRVLYERTPLLNDSYTNGSPSGTYRSRGFGYTLEGSADDPSIDPQSPRYVAETLPTRHFFTVHLPGERRCYLAEISDFNTNLPVTITKFHTNGPYAGEVISIRQMNGTLELFDYATNSAGTLRTNTVRAGAPNAGGTDVTNGTRTVSVVGLAGQLYWRQVYDIASGNALIESDSFALDELNRPVLITHLDGSTTGMAYQCCGLSGLTNREGSITTFEYDDLKRQTAEHRYLSSSHAISLLTAYDPLDNPRQVTRYGTNGTSIVLARFGYDKVSRLTAQTNAVNSVTTHEYSGPDGSGQNTVTTTFGVGTPEAATRLELYYRDRYLEKLTGTAVYPRRYTYGNDSGVGGFLTTETSLDFAGADTPEVGGTTLNHFLKVKRRTETWLTDRTPLVTTLEYNAQGDLSKVARSDFVTTFFINNTRGELEFTILDMDRDDQWDWAGSDRITRAVSDVRTDSNPPLLRTRTFVWPTDNTDEPVLAHTLEVSADGLHRWESVWGQTSRIDVNRAGGGLVYVTNNAPDGTSILRQYSHGLLLNETRYDTSGTAVGSTSFGYDAHGRRTTLTDARNGTTTLAYDDADRLTSVTTPDPGPGGDPQTTQYAYDALDRIWKTTWPDGGALTNEFYPTGDLKKTFGTRTYPVQYTRDAQGRLLSLTTWTNFASGSGAATTVFKYDTNGHWLTNITYADGKRTGFGYVSGLPGNGRLHKVTWERALDKTYGYNGAAELASVAYTAGAGPLDLAYTYNRLGRLSTVAETDGTTTSLSYNEAGRLLGESHNGGTLGGLSMTNQYDAAQRRTQVRAALNSSPFATNQFGYDAASRLATSASPSVSATYGYLANSPLVASLVFKQESTARLQSTNQFDFLDRPTSVSHSPQALSVAYAYNHANQRTRATGGENSFWDYSYDSLGQVTSAHRFWDDGSRVAGQQFEYQFDDIGNRTRTVSGGNEWGSNLRYAGYSSSLLNQILSRVVPGAVDIIGSATNAATVTVWPSTASLPVGTSRKGDYFRAEAPVDNTSGPVWLTITNIAVLRNGTNADTVASATGHLLVPAAGQTFAYDADGNLTNDGLWQFVWDAENRLIEVTSLPGVPDAAKRKVQLAYDYLGRRIQKRVSIWTNSTYSLQSTRRYLHDGWNVIAVLDGENTLLETFGWGTDLGGTFQGAGGVGALLWMTVHTGATAGTYFYAHDANGNVMGLVNAADGSVAATYEYGPFGEPLRSSGPLARENPFRFSSKYHDDETDLVYFGHRYYSASTGGWLSRDPLGEQGGLNLYAFVENNPISGVDYLGQWNLWSPGSYGVANAASWTLADSFNPFHESSGYGWDTFRQSLGSTLQGLTGRDWGLHYDRCDPAFRASEIAAQVARFAGVYGTVGAAAGWAARGQSLIRSLVGLGLEGYNAYESTAMVGSGLGHLAEGNALGLVELGLGALGLKGSASGFGRGLDRLAERSPYALRYDFSRLNTLPGGLVPNVVRKADSLAATRAPIFADNNVLVSAFRGNANALAEIRAGTTYVTPNQFREFLNVNEVAARRGFLHAEGVQLFGGPQAGQIARTAQFQQTFGAVVGAQGRADAALAAFARSTGYEAVTMERRLFNYLTQTLQDPTIPIRRITP